MPMAALAGRPVRRSPRQLLDPHHVPTRPVPCSTAPARASAGRARGVSGRREAPGYQDSARRRAARGARAARGGAAAACTDPQIHPLSLTYFTGQRLASRTRRRRGTQARIARSTAWLHACRSVACRLWNDGVPHCGLWSGGRSTLVAVYPPSLRRAARKAGRGGGGEAPRPLRLP